MDPEVNAMPDSGTATPGPDLSQQIPESQDAMSPSDDTGWVDQLDEMPSGPAPAQHQPQPQSPAYYAPPPPQQYYQQPYAPQPMPVMNQQMTADQRRAAIINAFVQNPEEFLSQAMDRKAEEKVMPVMEAVAATMREMHGERFNRAREVSMARLKDVARNDPALRNPAIRKAVGTTYMQLMQLAARGDISALKTLNNPLLPGLTLDMAKRLANVQTQQSSPVEYTGAPGYTQSPVAPRRPTQIPQAEVEFAKRWGISLDKWVENERLAEDQYNQ